MKLCKRKSTEEVTSYMGWGQAKWDWDAQTKTEKTSGSQRIKLA